MHFGEKVDAWLRRNRNQGLAPADQTALAAKIDESQPVVWRACKSGNPKLEVALKIARVMRESLDYLADADLPYPIPSAEAWDSFANSLTPAERERFAARAAAPAVRDLLLGQPRGVPGGRSPSLGGSRP